MSHTVLFGWLLHLLAIFSPFSHHRRPAAFKGAVSSELRECSQLGSAFYEKGGNAADVIVATAACIGTIASYHSGFGGGGFALVRLPDGSFESIDFRGSAPARINSTIFKQQPLLSLVGGLAVTVPGELRGLWEIHSRHGRLPWSTLFEPAVKLARDGFVVNRDLWMGMNATDPRSRAPTNFLPSELELEPNTEAALAAEPAPWSHFNDTKSFLITDPLFAAVFAPHGKFLDIGAVTTRPTYAQTLETIAREGVDAFYTGKLAEETVRAVQAKGGILSLEDLRNYKVHVKDALSVPYRNHTVYSCQAPSSGSLVLSVLNTMSGFPANHSDVDIHRLVEAVKFAYGQRTTLGDPDFQANVSTLQQEFLRPETGALIRELIHDGDTHTGDFYNPEHYEVLSDRGTSAMVAADDSGLSISLTTTVNLYWGSRIMVPESGIVLNDAMDDFSIEGRSNAFGYLPTPANFIKPGKRPLSSMSPLIVTAPDGSFKLATSSAGGSRIISAQAQIVRNALDFGVSALEALRAPRVHDQIYPAVTTLERDSPEIGFKGFTRKQGDALISRGHNVTFVPVGSSVACAVMANGPAPGGGKWEAAGDPRRFDSGGVVSE